ncbi:MAG: hypothetical protein CL609_05195 [Anaerolineaceae bacterium]|nr:hypothetical protein [Anaerolineaceae bacterium]
MNFLNFGPMEIAFILIIMIVVLGPKQMVDSAQKLGRFIRKAVKSPLWTTIMDTSKELRELPTRLVREAGLEEDIKEIKKTRDSFKDIGNISATYTPSQPRPYQKDINPDNTSENSILKNKPTDEAVNEPTEPVNEVSQNPPNESTDL